MLLAREFVIAGLLLGGVVWFWALSLRAREHALIACRRICREFNMQLLDQTVAMIRLRPARNRNGRICFQRRYGFEFSPDGHTRYRGRLDMTGLRPDSCQLDLPDGKTLVSATGRRLEGNARQLDSGNGPPVQ